MIPLIGFLEGDVLGLIVFAMEEDTIFDLCTKLMNSSSVRVTPQSNVCFHHQGRVLPLTELVRNVSFTPLDRIDVRRI